MRHACVKWYVHACVCVCMRVCVCCVCVVCMYVCGHTCMYVDYKAISIIQSLPAGLSHITHRKRAQSLWPNYRYKPPEGGMRDLEESLALVY